MGTVRKPNITAHVIDQLCQMNAQGIDLKVSEVWKAINDFLARNKRFPAGVQTGVEVKQFPKVVRWMDGKVQKYGDLVIAVVDVRDWNDNGRIATVMVRHHNQPSRDQHKPGADDQIYQECP